MTQSPAPENSNGPAPPAGNSRARSAAAPAAASRTRRAIRARRTAAAPAPSRALRRPQRLSRSPLTQLLMKATEGTNQSRPWDDEHSTRRTRAGAVLQQLRDKDRDANGSPPPGSGAVLQQLRDKAPGESASAASK